MPTYNVKITVAQHKTPELTYALNTKLPIGSIVRVPLRSKQHYGIIHAYTTKPSFKTKVATPLNKTLPKKTCAFLHKISLATAQSVSSFLSATLSHFSADAPQIVSYYQINNTALSPTQKKLLPTEITDMHFSEALNALGPRSFVAALKNSALTPKEKKSFFTSSIKLNAAQENALNAIEGAPFSLLEGVTGSGKTETYLQWALPILQSGASILIIVPTVNLVEQTALRVRKAFGVSPLRWHTMLGDTYKNLVFAYITQNAPQIIVGARSALFLPFLRLGGIIVDEEHDNCSYKQDSHPTYHARSAAYLLAQAHACPLLFTTATPSLETINAVHNGHITHTTINAPFHEGKKDWHIVDMRQTDENTSGYLSPTLRHHMQATIQHHGQCLLFINRKGFAPLTLCPQCGTRITCSSCTSFLVYYKKQHRLSCHHCEKQSPVPESCPHCDHPNLMFYGPAVERIEEEARAYFPQARTMILSSDILSSQKSFKESNALLRERGVDIIISTQVFSTGIDIPHLDLVGFVDAEMGRSFHDIRANEHAFQMLVQTAGRCGRHKKHGAIIIQTFNPDDPILRSIIAGDSASFRSLELQDRKAHKLPPYYKLALLHLQSKNKEKLIACAQQHRKVMPKRSHIDVMGPSDAPMPLRKNTHRMFFLIRAQTRTDLLSFITEWLKNAPSHASVATSVDTEPTTFI